MALLERVATLVRANINDLLSKTEDPVKLCRQLVLDMENQLLQVKTQVAIAIADQHLLLNKKTEQEDLRQQWIRKAELAIARGKDELARAALERAVSYERMAQESAKQHTDQTSEAETLRAAYTRLQQKLTETQSRVELLTAQHRRNRAAHKMQIAQQSDGGHAKLDRLSAQVADGALRNQASRTVVPVVATETLDERFESIEQKDQVEALLLELKQRQPRLA